MKRLSLFLTIALLTTLIQAIPKPAAAQSNCSDFSFPQTTAGWVVNVGTADDTNKIVNGASGTIDVTLFFDLPVYVTSITLETFAVPQLGNRDIQVLLFDPNYSANPPSSYPRLAEIIAYPDVTLPLWRKNTFYFNNIATNQIEFIVVQDAFSGGMGLHVITICVSGFNVITMTASPTLSPTPTITPTPSHTPTPTPVMSPTPTNTPAISDTPGPATSTEGPTSTNIPTSTNGPSVQTGNYLFNTPSAPDQCTDVLNPCGAMPYPVPGMATLNLPSPPASTAASVASTPTYYPSMTAWGTPSGSGTPTPGPADAFFNYATGIANNLAITTPGLLDGDGNVIDLANGANQIGSYAGQFFAILKALQSFFLGKTGNIIAILIFIAGFVIFVKLALWMIPVIRTIATFIVGFIP